MALNKPVQDSWRTQTLAVRGGTRRSEFGETGEAIFATSGFVYENAEQAENAFQGQIDRFIYSRFSNPTVNMFEERMALIDGADKGKATATGMSAVFASIACMVEAGDHIVASRALFGSCLYILTDILPKYGLETTIVDGTDLNQWEDALKRPTKCVFVETPSNPGLDIVDIRAVADLARNTGAKVIVDNVFATPLLQKPIQLGADIVVYSATKHIDGQGRCLGGIVLGEEDFCENTLKPFLRHTGPSLSPFNAWVMLKGLETLDLRIRQHCENASLIANYLETRGDLLKVRYPGLKSHPQHDLAARQMSGFGNVVTFSHQGGKEAAFKFMNAMKLIDISNNLGDSKSLMTHPATTTHQRLSEEDRAALGLDDGMVRLSVGLEDPVDVREDLEQSFAAI
ncbi:MAG: O-succinylhomoserine sulfhydrylase [Pseudomonadota bacterium]|nr:O-succinylhomoserine sulfhydrylase [Pseudomonadota bacterium]